MTNILLIGCGAREHAIAEAIMRSHERPSIYAVMAWKNPGIIKLCADYIIAAYNDFKALEILAIKIKPEFCMIGPEAPLVEGVVDFLEGIGVPCVGPKKELAQLESSKSFTRNLMHKHKIQGLPKFHVFDSYDGIEEYLDLLEEEGLGFVIKPDGLTGGKGVMVQDDHLKDKAEAALYCKKNLAKGGLVIEEKLQGEEFSLQCFTDGKTVIGMPPVQDHKRAFEDDKGPNTGGMGSYSMENHLLPFINEMHVSEALDITQRVLDALRQETGEYYKGIMYGGFMLTNKGVKLIEYNARFGDPETMNVLPIMVTDFVEVCRAIVQQKLQEMEIVFESKATVCKYAVPEGYPDNPRRGEKISIGNIGREAKTYFASVQQDEHDASDSGQVIMLGSRAIACVGIANTVHEAERIAEHAVARIQGPVFHRKDIGTQALLQKRIDHMEKLAKR